MHSSETTTKQTYSICGVNFTEQFLQEFKGMTNAERLENIRELNLVLNELITRSNNPGTFEQGFSLVLMFQRMLTEIEIMN